MCANWTRFTLTGPSTNIRAQWRARLLYSCIAELKYSTCLGTAWSQGRTLPHQARVRQNRRLKHRFIPHWGGCSHIIQLAFFFTLRVYKLWEVYLSDNFLGYPSQKKNQARHFFFTLRVYKLWEVHLSDNFLGYPSQKKIHGQFYAYIYTIIIVRKELIIFLKYVVKFFSDKINSKA